MATLALREILSKKCSSELLALVCSVSQKFIDDMEESVQSDLPLSLVYHNIEHELGFTLGESMKVVWAYKILKERGEV